MIMPDLQATSKRGLAFRDAVAESSHVESDLVFASDHLKQPLVTIAIPTFRRAGLLAEAVQSAIKQDFRRPFEVIVIDNNPGSTGATELLDRLPEIRDRNFRYFVNQENTGMFGNFNRCLQLARGEWITILNDDDLLDASYLSLMFATLDRRKSLDGLISKKRILDQRSDASNWSPSFPRRAAKRLLLEASYFGRATRRIRPAKLFWEPLLGNGGGFIFRRQAALDIGGFYPEEFPSSDWWFFVRFATRYELRQHRALGASIRVAENESAKLSTMKRGLMSGYRLQQALAGSEVPGWWRQLSPFILARHCRNLEEYWKVELPRAEIEEALGIRIPPDRPRLYKLLRVAFGGF
jgi:glycosyltransferase involved in cell wall biosynthesis